VASPPCRRFAPPSVGRLRRPRCERCPTGNSVRNLEEASNKKRDPKDPFSYLARPERLARIALGRFSGLRPAVATLRRPKRYRVLSNRSSHPPSEHFYTKKGPKRPLFCVVARPERFELPTARFVVSSLFSNILKYNKVRWGARCMNCPTAHNSAQPNHAKVPHFNLQDLVIGSTRISQFCNSVRPQLILSDFLH